MEEVNRPHGVQCDNGHLMGAISLRWSRRTPRTSSSPPAVLPEIRRPGSASCSNTGRCSTARPMRSTAAAALASSPDSLYAELYGIKDRPGDRRSLFSYFPGAQQPRDVAARGASLSAMSTGCERNGGSSRSDEEGRRRQKYTGPRASRPVAASRADPDRSRYLASDAPGARPRGRPAGRARSACGSRCYYVQELTLAETGRVLKEHEATVSRQLARTRRAIRRRGRAAAARRVAGLNDDQVAACFEWVAGDPGSLDLKRSSMNEVPARLLRATLRARGPADPSPACLDAGDGRGMGGRHARPRGERAGHRRSACGRPLDDVRRWSPLWRMAAHSAT